MTDIEVTVLVIKAAAVADGSCVHCSMSILEKAMSLQPDLPWLLAAQGLTADNEDYRWALSAIDRCRS